MYKPKLTISKHKELKLIFILLICVRHVFSSFLNIYSWLCHSLSETKIRIKEVSALLKKSGFNMAQIREHPVKKSSSKVTTILI